MVKIGDSIRALCDTVDITKGKVYEVIGVEGSLIGVYDDMGETNWLLHQINSELVSASDDDELTALRAWKEVALARFPALEEPETDEEAAERFTERSYEIDRVDAFIEAFAWARANPR